MRYVIVDCGSVGLELAARWRDQGHEVVGTTPNPVRLPAIRAVCADAVQLSHDDADAVRDAVRDADAAVLASRPKLLYARSLRERVVTFRRSMIGLTRAVASVQRRLVALSSIVVYGPGTEPGGDSGLAPITETVPVTTALDPAAQGYAAVERMVLESPEAAVLRLPEVVIGHPDDPDPGAAMRQLREHMGNALPFDGSALTHFIDYRDAAAAVAHIIEHRLSGIFNVVPDQVVPPTVEAYLAALTADAGLDPFAFTGEVKAPRRPVSSAKLRSSGFGFQYSSLPTPHPV